MISYLYITEMNSVMSLVDKYNCTNFIKCNLKIDKSYFC